MIMIETEAKWELIEAGQLDCLRENIKKYGGNKIEIHNEVNVILDNESEGIRISGQILRIRYINKHRRALFTFKGPVKMKSGIKQRNEVEIAISNGKKIEYILSQLGYFKRLEYSKMRERWQLDNTNIMLDRLPFGEFCEIEGSLESVRKMAIKLGFSEDQCETQDYPTIMRKYLRLEGE